MEAKSSSIWRNGKHKDISSEKNTEVELQDFESSLLAMERLEYELPEFWPDTSVRQFIPLGTVVLNLLLHITLF